jgi:hypothetical protein
VWCCQGAAAAIDGPLYTSTRYAADMAGNRGVCALFEGFFRVGALERISLPNCTESNDLAQERCWRGVAVSGAFIQAEHSDEM